MPHQPMKPASIASVASVLRWSLLALLAVPLEARLRRNRFAEPEPLAFQWEEAALWEHLKAYVLPHRRRLGTSVRLQVLLPGAVKASDPPDEMRRSFVADALPSGMQLADRSAEATAAHVYYGAGCDALALSAKLWHDLEPGAILAAPVCSEEEFQRAYGLLYTVNCAMLYNNHICGNATGKRMSCEDFRHPGLNRVGFLPGFFVLEKRDETSELEKLGKGDFLTNALQDLPPTDKVTKHHYQEMYERYFPSKQGSKLPLLETSSRSTTALELQRLQARSTVAERYLSQSRASRGHFLEIGLGCNMGYGPGKSADLWRKYFMNMNISFVEYDGECVKRWSEKVKEKGINVIVGDQLQAETNERAAAAAGPGGYDIVIDDGAHLNAAIRTSFKYLWPAMAPGGFYVMEDLGEPAFSYLDCEPIPTPDYQQRTTALAKVIQVARPMVLGLGESALARAECDLEVCLLEHA